MQDDHHPFQNTDFFLAQKENPPLAFRTSCKQGTSCRRSAYNIDLKLSND